MPNDFTGENGDSSTPPSSLQNQHPSYQAPPAQNAYYPPVQAPPEYQQPNQNQMYQHPNSPQGYFPQGTDPRHYQAAPPTGYYGGPAPLKPWYTKKRFIIPLICIALLMFTSCLGAASKSSSNSSAISSPTATVTVTPKAEVAAPPVAAPPPVTVPTASATPAPKVLTIPTGMEGRNAQLVYEEIKKLGFQNVIMNSTVGGTPLMYSNWTVVSVDGAGQNQLSDVSVVIHVTK